MHQAKRNAFKSGVKSAHEQLKRNYYGTILFPVVWKHFPSAVQVCYTWQYSPMQIIMGQKKNKAIYKWDVEDVTNKRKVTGLKGSWGGKH